MVALSGAHTIGFSHCKEFSSGIYNYSRSSQSNPSYNPRFAEGLRKACSDYQKNPTLSVFNDIMTPNKFDNMYFQNLPKGLGLLATDHTMATDPRTRQFTDLYAKNQSAFFEAFGRAMEKLGLYGIKTGRRGEIRRRVLPLLAIVMLVSLLWSHGVCIDSVNWATQEYDNEQRKGKDAFLSGI
ncbi:Peroxidase 31 [Vitis vinifera]|uniref:peroxidase n=1 Tax=Vitis vinifera TaxID=29760 RepID=A0A438JIT6_VITVI|nr:Peroxidase 31 [Vitis vinifera]